MKTLTLLFLLLCQITYTQSSIVSETINKIDIKEDTIKSVYDWLTDNIKYDVKKLKELENRRRSPQKSKFKSKEAYQEDLLKTVIKKKKGVCEDYALLFHRIVSQLGYESFVVEGYTKNDKGKVQKKIGHAWNAIKANGEWRLYDATWGAGYIEDEKKFVKHYNQEWFNMPAEEMLYTHMPFDPIWQLSKDPITYESFDSNHDVVELESPFDYDDVINTHLRKDEKEQMRDQVTRSKELGDGIKLIEKWRKRLTKSVGLYEIGHNRDKLKSLNEKIKDSAELFNDYIDAKNKKFKGKKRSVEKSKLKLVTAKEQTIYVIDAYKSITIEDSKASKSMKKAISQSEKLLKRIEKELLYVEKL